MEGSRTQKGENGMEQARVEWRREGQVAQDEREQNKTKFRTAGQSGAMAFQSSMHTGTIWGAFKSYNAWINPFRFN